METIRLEGNTYLDQKEELRPEITYLSEYITQIQNELSYLQVEVPESQITYILKEVNMFVINFGTNKYEDQIQILYNLGYVLPRMGQMGQTSSKSSDVYLNVQKPPKSLFCIFIVILYST